MWSPYRSSPPLPPRPAKPQPSCPCGMSIEQKMAFNAIGGWFHTVECVKWHEINGKPLKFKKI